MLLFRPGLHDQYPWLPWKKLDTVLEVVKPSPRRRSWVGFHMAAGGMAGLAARARGELSVAWDAL